MAKDVTQKILDETVRPIHDRLKEVNILLFGLVIAMFLGFGAMFFSLSTLLIEIFSERKAADENLQDEIQLLNSRMEFLSGEMKRANDARLAPNN